MENNICIGVIAGSFGVKGDVRLKSFATHPEDIAKYAPLYTENGKRSFDVSLKRPVKGGFAAQLSGVNTKDEADALKGTKLFTPRTRLPKLPDDEFYHSDLIGLNVIDTGGVSLGHIAAVHNHGAGDMLEIQGAGLKQSVLLPFTKEAVPNVDIENRRVIVDPPEGVF